MLYYILVFFVLAMIAGFLGFAGIAGAASGIANLEPPPQFPTKLFKAWLT